MFRNGVFLVFVLFFLFKFNNAQNSLYRRELPKEYELWDIIIKDKPMPSVKYSGFCIAWHRLQNSLILYGVTGPDQIIYLEKFEPRFRFNGNTKTTLEYKDGKVMLCSRTPNSAEEVCGHFTWDGKRLIFEKEQSYDPNLELLNRAKTYKAAGKIKEAIMAFDSISFAATYFNAEQEACEMLLKIYEESKLLAEKNKYKDAAENYRRIMGFSGFKAINELKTQNELSIKFGKKLYGLSSEDYLNIISDYLQVLLKARLFDEFLSINGKYLMLFADPSEIYKWRGDAYFAKRDKPKYVENYNKYVQLMKDKKKEKAIEEYVLGRLK